MLPCRRSSSSVRRSIMFQSCTGSRLFRQIWTFKVLDENSCVDIRTIRSFLKRNFVLLSENQLRSLKTILKSKGRLPSDCILIDENSLNLRSYLWTIEQLCCYAFRWGDHMPFPCPAELKTLPECRKNKGISCCNPYHYGRVQHFNDRHQAKSGALPFQRRETASSDDGDQSSAWCHVAYWEYQQRFGRQFRLSKPCLNIFQELPLGLEGLCLQTIQKDQCDKSVRKARTRIGAGVTVWRESDAVYLYNRCLFPVFLSMPTSEVATKSTAQWGCSVMKLMPGCVIHLCQFEAPTDKRPPGYVELCSVQLSFVKGFGPNYTRLDVTGCPCWLELSFSPTPS